MCCHRPTCLLLLCFCVKLAVADLLASSPRSLLEKRGKAAFPPAPEGHPIPVIQSPVISPLSGNLRFTCPSGFDLVFNKCVKTMTTPPTVSCPYGSYRNQHRECLSVDSLKPERACPPGFDTYEYGCVRRLLSSPIPECPSKFAVNPTDPSSCLSTDNTQPSRICNHSEGGLLRSDGLCEAQAYSATNAKCPGDYQLSHDGTQCIRVIHNEPLYGCPPGYVYTPPATPSSPSSCDQMVEVAAVVTCAHEGFERTVDGACERIQTFSKTKTCPPEYTLSHYAKIPHPTNAGSTTRSHRGGDTQSSGPQQSHGTPPAEADASGYVCYRVVVHIESVPHCKEGWTYDPNKLKCTYTLEEDPVFACPAAGMEPYPIKSGSSGSGESWRHLQTMDSSTGMLPRVEDGMNNNDITNNMYSNISTKQNNANQHHLSSLPFALAPGECVSVPLLHPSMACPLGSSPAAPPDNNSCVERQQRHPIYSLNCRVGAEGVNSAGVPVCVTQVKTEPVVVGCKAQDRGQAAEQHGPEESGGGGGEQQEEEDEEESLGGGASRLLGVLMDSWKASSSPRRSFSTGAAPLNWLRGPLEANTMARQEEEDRAVSGDDLYHRDEKREEVKTETAVNSLNTAMEHTVGNETDESIVCTEVLTSDISHVCPAASSYRVNSSTCKQIYRYPADLQCPDGMYLHLQKRHARRKETSSSSTTTKKTSSSSTSTKKTSSSTTTKKTSSNITTKTSSSTTSTTTSTTSTSASTSPHVSTHASATCMSSHHVAAHWKCPEGYRIVSSGEGGGKKKHKKGGGGGQGRGATSSPQLMIVPNIFTGASFNHQIRTFDKKLKKAMANPEGLHGGTGMCERLEYAQVQIVCPVGYKMEKETQHREPGKGCVAEKSVPATHICQPGYFLRGEECVKLVEVAPSVVTAYGDTVPCAIGHSNAMSCGGITQPYFSPVKNKKLKKE
eukprot:GHVS01009397.1.p1 GENE.GHVS01009397.1~~GHVS01009397.1.p1  ORF type:complete len:952 (+),score=177.59 GHVS01009397.1:117-2972(+)